jgi:roadblock/LC7 domain-containing protein
VVHIFSCDLKETIHKAFSHRNYGSKCVALGYNSTYFSNKIQKGKTCYSAWIFLSFTSFWRNSDSYEYQNKSARIGAQFVLVGMHMTIFQICAAIYQLLLHMVFTSRNGFAMQGPVAIIPISGNVIFIWETGYWTRNQILKRLTFRFHYGSNCPAVIIAVLKAVPNPMKQMSKTILRHTLIAKYFWHFCWLPYLYAIGFGTAFNTAIMTAGQFEP